MHWCTSTTGRLRKLYHQELEKSWTVSSLRKLIKLWIPGMPYITFISPYIFLCIFIIMKINYFDNMNSLLYQYCSNPGKCCHWSRSWKGRSLLWRFCEVYEDLKWSIGYVDRRSKYHYCQLYFVLVVWRYTLLSGHS